MPNHFTVTIGQDPPYPCEYDEETNTLKAELPGLSPHGEQAEVKTIRENSGNILHQQIWANAMAYLNAEGMFKVPAPPAGASRISNEDLADMNKDLEISAPHPVLSGPSQQTTESARFLKVELVKADEEIALLQSELGILQSSPQTSPETVIAVQRVIINQMHSLYAVAVGEDEKMLAVMQQLLEDGEAVYGEWRGETNG